MRRLRFMGWAATLIAAAAVWLAAASVAAATDDYTLPFYDPNVGLSYGMDRDWRLRVQLDWTGKVWWDSVPHWGRVYDNHTGLDYPMALRSTIAAARAGTVIDVEGGFGTQQKGQFGNFVLMSHSDGRRTLYYHLASAAEGGIHHGVGKQLAAGASVGLSGCSGICSGPHLHFEVLLVSG
ncbi:MAG TPA: M23 family metallopeptidase, partial [Candidatus Limnocylindria bacterium]|nr:M23 family metallopeptidase [Candidatus Limnocylindria bacterium]